MDIPPFQLSRRRHIIEHKRVLAQIDCSAFEFGLPSEFNPFCVIIVRCLSQHVLKFFLCNIVALSVHSTEEHFVCHFHFLVWQCIGSVRKFIARSHITHRIVIVILVLVVVIEDLLMVIGQCCRCRVRSSLLAVQLLGLLLLLLGNVLGHKGA
ncbi:hypothetical protein D3C80_1632110 [compost metagenome]